MYAETIIWNEIKIRKLTGEEKAEYEEGDYLVPEYIIEGRLPDDGQLILIATQWGVQPDTCIADVDGYGLEDMGEWIDVLAWAEFPRYKM